VKPFQSTHEQGGVVVAPTLSLVGEFRDMLDSRAEVSLSLMDSSPWDLFMVVFTGPDRMGHYLWPYHRTAEEKDSPEVRQLCEAVREYYVRLDEVVGELVNKAGDEVSVVVMSDHGMGPKQSKRLHCNVWLQKHGWLSTESDAPQLTNPDNWARRIGLPRDKVGRIVFQIPGLARSRFVKRAIKSRSLKVDLQHSQAYCVPMYNHVMGIRIKLSGQRREALRQEIMRELKQIVDPETGQAVVREVCKGEDYYYGPYAENVPDIIVVMEPDYACSTSLGTYSSVVTKLQVSPDGGGHRMEGIFLASGAHILASSVPLPDLVIEDIAPTVLYLMDLPVPSEMDGRVLTEVLSPTTVESRPIRHGMPMNFWPNADEAMRNDEALSQEDDADIRKRLQALGYLE
jgi:predicted AlkP superfamily phosphohydrolase/phosphomutase